MKNISKMYIHKQSNT